MSRMRTPALALLLTVPLLLCSGALAQARGPSAREVQENGQAIGTSVPEWWPYLDQLSRQSGATRARLESSRLYWNAEEGFVLVDGELRFALGKWGPPAPPPLDTASRISKNEEQQAWLTRLVGRFRLAGRAQSRYNLRIVDPNNPLNFNWVWTTSSGDISGIADCAAVGKSAGVQCILNATWPVVEYTVPSDRDGRPLPSEAVRLFQPAMVVFGINPDTAEISATMVTDDSITHTWAGRLEANTLIARRINDCVDPLNLPVGYRRPPCFQPLEIVATPDGAITMENTFLGVNIRLDMRRDPAARAKQPIKTRKVN